MSIDSIEQETLGKGKRDCLESTEAREIGTPVDLIKASLV